VHALSDPSDVVRAAAYLVALALVAATVIAELVVADLARSRAAPLGSGAIFVAVPLRSGLAVVAGRSRRGGDLGASHSRSRRSSQHRERSLQDRNADGVRLGFGSGISTGP
jgi:hypothetical protein